MVFLPFLLVVTYIVSAQIKPSVTEYSFTGYFDSVAPEEEGKNRTESISMNGEIGHFIMPRHQIGSRISYDWMSGRPNRMLLSGVYSAHLNPGSQNLIFFSASPGMALNGLPSRPHRAFDMFDFDETTKFNLGLGAGLKSVVIKNVAIRAEYRYERTWNTKLPDVIFNPGGGFNGRKTNFDRHSIFVGISIFQDREYDR